MTRKRETIILGDLLQTIEKLEERIKTIEQSQDQYNEVNSSGGLRLDLLMEEGSLLSFFMVTDITIGDEMAFFHLVKPNDPTKPIDINNVNETTFPAIDEDEALYAYIRRVEDSGEYDKVMTVMNINSIARHSIKGYFTYKEPESTGFKEMRPIPIRPPDNVVSYKK